MIDKIIEVVKEYKFNFGLCIVFILYALIRTEITSENIAYIIILTPIIGFVLPLIFKGIFKALGFIVEITSDDKKPVNKKVCPYCGSHNVVGVYDSRIKKRNIVVRVILLPFTIIKIILCLIFPPLALVAFDEKEEEYLSHHHCNNCGYDY